MARTTETTGHAGAMKRFFALAVAVMAFTASARTVYDAGKALRQNCESGSYANPYTDTNGGVYIYARYYRQEAEFWHNTHRTKRMNR